MSINTTNSVTEEFGHTDMNAPEFVRLDYLNETIDVERIFPNLDRLDTLVSTELFKKVLPKLPPPAPTPQAAQERTRSQLEVGRGKYRFLCCRMEAESFGFSPESFKSHEIGQF